VTACPACSSPTRPGARFCPRCGLFLEPNCPRCGSALTPLAIFCDHCGTQVSALPGVSAWPSGALLGGVPPALMPAPLPPARPEPAIAPPPARAPAPPPEARARSATSAIPRELAAKLEAARASGEMVGERRIVTMLFCDVKGSTEAAERLDPEDWTEIMNGAFEHMIRPVYTYEGTLARLMGDALLAFFGAPIAHEDDPQRAVLAGLDILRDLQPYREAVRARWGLDINVRVGINTGLVVVGAVGSDLRVEYSALGDAINLAARMEQTAAPGTVQIAHDTYRHVKALFEVEPLGGIEVKGKSEPVPAYRVLGRKSAASRVRGIEGLQAALVGREAELQTLRDVVNDLQQGVGRIVCILGEAGVGKSRLVAEGRQAFVQPDSFNGEWHETGSLSYESSQPYGLFQRLLRRVLALDYNTPEHRLREQLAAVAHTLPAERQAGAQVAFETLFGLEHAPGQGRLEGAAFQRELYEAIGAWWWARWGQQPAVLVFDDMHWCDAASVALLIRLLPLTEQMPLVLLGVMRGERQAPAWQLKTTADDELHHRYTEIALRPLSLPESSELVNRLLAVADLPDRLRASILEKAGGNPFFVEEVVRTLIDSGAVVPEERGLNGQRRRYWVASSAGAEVAIPDNLQALLAARLDRLEEDTRSLLQLASVIGRSFYYRVLARLAADGPAAMAEFDRHLGTLVRSEMIQEAARLPEVEYKFRNPLMQEATYHTILHKRRREYHQRVGEAMEALFPERLTELAPRLAYHFAEGGQGASALKYYTLAGDRAARLYANQEAIRQYDQAIALAVAPGSRAATETLIHLFLGQGRALELNAQNADALAVYQRMEALALERGDRALELAALIAQGTQYSTATTQHNQERAHVVAERGLDLARALGDGAAEAKIHWNLMNSYRFSDDPQRATEAGERSLKIARELGLREQMAYALNDLFYVYQSQDRLDEAHTANREARALWRELDNRAMLADSLGAAVVFEVFNGDLDQGMADAAEALEIARSINNIWGMAFSQMGVAIAYWLRGDFGRALQAMDMTIRYGEQAGFVVGPLWARAQMGLVYCHLGQPERGLAIADEARARAPAMAVSTPPMAIMHGYIALAYVAAGDVEQAQGFLDKAFVTSHGMGLLDELVAWGRVAVLMARGRLADAEATAQQMLDVLRGANMRLLLPEILLNLARAQRGLGRPAEALNTLAQARVEAESMDLRWPLWQIFAEQVRLLPETEAQAALAEARVHLTFIADHTGDEALRQSFLARPEVRAILSE
jgi:class 3 adenylate cyclase